MTELQHIHLLMATNFLRQYLESFPEHDQGDIRVWEANMILNRVLDEEANGTLRE